MRWLRNSYGFMFKWTATAAIGIRPTKARLLKLFKNAIWHFRRTICNKIIFYTWKKMPQKRMEYFRLLFDHLALIAFEWHERFNEGRESLRDDERCRRSKEINTPELIGQKVKVRVTMLRFLGSSGTDSAGRGQHPSNRFSGISTRTMHSPQLHPCHILFHKDGHQDSSSASL